MPEYNNLTEFLLGPVKERPGMYLGKNHISLLQNLILGYMIRDGMLEQEHDFYFGDNGFMIWYEKTYNPPKSSHWDWYFLLETNEDQVKALELYFDRLEEYYQWFKAKVHIT